MTPTIGRIVLTRGLNENELSPAIIIKVWNPDCVNVTVFSSEGSMYLKTSCMLRESLADDDTNGVMWPPRAD